MDSAFDGRIVWPTDAGFELACTGRVFNHRRPARRPVAVVEAANAEDVVRAVRLARTRGWKVSVRAGGHSWAAWSLRDDALLIDVGALREIAYDPDTGIVVAGPAVRGGADLDPVLADHDRFFAAGHCPTPGLGGFLLQGGMGWNCRGWGWAAEQIVAIDVVTAAGDLVRADADTNADLFWVARGAGPGFFGVVCAFHLRTRPRFRALTQTVMVYPAGCARDVLAWMHRVHRDIAPSVEVVVLGITIPLPPEVAYTGSVIVVNGLSFEDTHGEGVRSLEPLLSCPVLDRALVTAVGVPTTLAEQRVEQARANPEGHRYTVDNAWLDGDADDVARRLAPAFTELPTPQSFTLWFDMAPARPIPDMALSLQTDIYFAAYVVCADAADDERCRTWLDERMRDLEPVTVGCYLGDSDLAHRAQRFMAEDNFARLEWIRAARDPDGLFVGYRGDPAVPVNTNYWAR